MDLVLTPDDLADLLELETDQITTMFESGALSGFKVNDQWRIAPAAMRADLVRLRAHLEPVEPVVLAPYRQPQVLESRPPTSRDHNQFSVRIEVENHSNYVGDFVMFLSSESGDDRWHVQYAAECKPVGGELLVRDSLPPQGTVTFYEATLEGELGERLFLTIPEQPALNEELERVFVLQGDIDLHMTLTDKGFFGKRRLRLKKR